MKLGDTGATAQVVKVTPEVATEWLSESNGHNRKLSQAYVNRLVAALDRDEYLFTGDTIKFDNEGYLIDGQHRLAAIAAGDVTYELIVVKGLDPQAIHVIDAESRSRTLADVFTIEGVPHASSTAAVVKMTWGMEQTGLPYASGRDRMTVTQGLDFLERRLTVIQSATKGRQLYGTKPKTLTAQEFGGLYEILSHSHGELVGEWLEQIALGYGPKGSTSTLLRRRIQNHTDTAEHRSKTYVLAITTKAWNAELAGEKLRQLRWDSDKESFPELNGLEEWRQAGAF